jgi:hypothetical protein
MREDCSCTLQDECECNVQPKGYCGEVSAVDWAVVYEMECCYPVMPIGCYWIQPCPPAL